MKPEDLIGKVPWITKDGFDPAKFPIDGVLVQALDADSDTFRSGVRTLEMMCHHGRREAGVFLLGLLLASEGDSLERKAIIVEALGSVRTEACADLLFAELRRVKSSNTTRRYLATVIKVLASLPAELIQDGFAELAADKSFSQKMRDKFRAVMASADGLGDEWF